MIALLSIPLGLDLLDPWMLLGAPALAVALGVRLWRGGAAVRFAPGAFLAPALPRSWRARLAFAPGLIQILGLLLVVLALARPVHRRLLPHQREGLDILLCLDISSSMQARDMDPRRSRLDVARDSAASFIAARPDDRIGLIRFARYPDLLCPPTLDHRALGEILAGLQPVERDSAEDQTGIGSAVARAAQVLRAARTRSRVVILFTDGEENVATAQTPDEIGPARAARLCAALGVRAYTIAAGAGSPDPTGRWKAPDTTQVERLAALSGGKFYRARDAGALAGVYESIGELETAPIEEPRYEIEERFAPFLAAALALILLGGLLRYSALEVLP